ncbi:MAG: sporulation initiation factor Spo0A C-terminal domain-containing protein [Eubacteriales bacterium]|nr:sporulation initiation factor Spo0A C-terminal domain-containing protein [Eubacteriales bacterium]
MEKVIRLLHRLGITPGYRGYRQAIIALELLDENEDWMCSIMELYSEIAYLNHTTQKAVERNIRTLSKRAWTINPKLLERLAGYPLKEEPANTDFLFMLLNYKQRTSSPQPAGQKF